MTKPDLIRRFPLPRSLRICPFGVRPLLGLLLLLSLALPALADDTAAVRQLLCKAILSEGDEQTKVVAALADTNSDLVRKVLTAWPNDGVYLIDPGNGQKIPVMLED